MRVAKMTISLEALEAMLQFKPDMTITQIAPQSGDQIANRQFDIVVKGDDMPKHREGNVLQVVPWTVSKP